MVKPADKIATYEDLFDLPENLVGEIFGGEIIAHPRPAPKHARAASIIGATLSSRFDFKMTGDDSGWWIIDEPECHIGGDIVVPGIAGWRKKTMLELPDTAWFDISPDWVSGNWYPHVEPSERSFQRVKAKCRLLIHRRLTAMPLVQLMARLNRVLRGWCNYFHYRNSSGVLSRLKYFVEGRVRDHMRRRFKLYSRVHAYKRFPTKRLYELFGLYAVRTTAGWR